MPEGRDDRSTVGQSEQTGFDPVTMMLEVIDLDSGAARTTEDIFTGASHPMHLVGSARNVG